MLLLTSTGDLMQIATSVAVPIDVHVSWVDVTNAGAITPGRKNQALTTNALVIIVPSPPASTQRNVKSIHIRNKDATTSCQVIVLIYDGVTNEQIFDVILPANRALEYTDQGGFRVL